MPRDGIEKPPSTPSNPRVNHHLKKAGLAVGIDFTGKSERYPNTLQAHALLEYCKIHGDKTQNTVAEALFQAYFTDGQYLDENTLVDIAEKCGLNKGEVRNYITDDTIINNIKEKASSWSEKGVTGVPNFLMNGKQVFSGAQEPNAFLKMFDVVAAKQ